MNAALISSIISYSNRYRQEMLDKYDPARLLTDWWSALDFFFSRVCFQGRHDEISERVYQEITGVLSRRFYGEERTANYERERKQKWKTLKAELEQRIGKGKVGKAGDISMVLSTLDFIGPLPGRNIVHYSVNRIRSCEISKHYDELRSIYQIGPKVASLYLRDIVSLYQLEGKVSNEFAFCLQPVDVWVRKLVHKTGIVDNRANDREIQDAIVALCKEHRRSPLQFNQGAWYAGHFALDLLLETLARVPVKVEDMPTTA